LLVAAVALPVCAQRGGSHGGFSGHGAGAPGFHGGPVASSNYRMAPPRYTGNRIATMPPGFRGAGIVGGYGGGSAYSGYHHGYGGEREEHHGAGFYRGPVWFGTTYLGYPGYPFDYGLSDYGFADTPGYDPATVAPDYGAAGAAGYAAGPPPDNAAGAPYGYAAGDSGQAGQGYRPPYQPSAAPSPAAPAPTAAPEPPSPSSTPAVEEAVTLVYKDGRSEQIHNYAMTRTTLYVQDQHHREIPLDEIDLAATERVNRKAGMSFEVPSGAR